MVVGLVKNLKNDFLEILVCNQTHLLSSSYSSSFVIILKKLICDVAGDDMWRMRSKCKEDFGKSSRFSTALSAFLLYYENISFCASS